MHARIMIGVTIHFNITLYLLSISIPINNSTSGGVVSAKWDHIRGSEAWLAPRISQDSPLASCD